MEGLLVARVEEILLALCRDLGPLDALAALDSALHLGLTRITDLEEAARRRRRGAPLLRALLPLADPLCESPWETYLREFHRCVEAPVVSQHEVRAHDGTFVARADLHLVGTRTIHEYDGHHHLERERQRHDLRRSRRLEAAGWVRRGYTSEDLLHHPEQILREVDRSLGRADSSHLLVRWHDLLRDSGFTLAGARLLAARLAPNAQRPTRSLPP